MFIVTDYGWSFGKENADMGRYLNSIVPLETYKKIAGTRFFVDKTLLLEDILNAVEMDGQKYLCITRPRRFGKSVMANMIGCFLGKSSDSSGIFGDFAIAGSEYYGKHLNQHSVIFIDFSRVPRDCGSYEKYIDCIQDGINRDLAEAYPRQELIHPAVYGITY